MRTGGPPSLINNVKFNPIYCSLLYGSFFIIWFMILYWGSLWQLSNPIRIISEKRSSYNHHHDKHDHHHHPHITPVKSWTALPVSFQKRTLDHPHHHPHITPVKMRESLKFSFLPTSSSPPAVVSAIILSNNFANKVPYSNPSEKYFQIYEYHKKYFNWLFVDAIILSNNFANKV